MGLISELMKSLAWERKFGNLKNDPVPFWTVWGSCEVSGRDIRVPGSVGRDLQGKTKIAKFCKTFW